MLQWRYHIEALFDVPPEAFEPPPRVVSAVVRMLPWPAPAALDAGVLEELVRVAFSQRRKLLRHTLGRWLEERGFGGAFDLQRRAEEVPVAEYVALAQAVGGGADAVAAARPPGAKDRDHAGNQDHRPDDLVQVVAHDQGMLPNR